MIGPNPSAPVAVVYLVNVNVVTIDQLVGRHSERPTDVLLLTFNVQ